MKKQLAVLTYLLITISIYSQNAKLKWGSPSKYMSIRPNQNFTDVFDIPYYVAGTDDKTVYAIALDRGGMMLDKVKYNYQTYSKDNLNLINTAEIDMSKVGDSKSVIYVASYYSNNSTFLLVSAYDEKIKTLSLFIKEIPKDGNLNKLPKKVYQLTNVQGKYDYTFKSKQSLDKSKTVVYAKDRYDTEGTEQPCSFIVFDTNFNELTKETYPLKVKNQAAFIKGLSVTNSGDVHFSIGINVTKDQYVRRIISYYSDIKQFKEQEIPLPGKEIMYETYGADNNSNFIITGYYSNEKVKNYGGPLGDKTDGVFYQKIDKASKAITVNETNPIEENITSQLSSTRLGRAPELVMKDLITDEAGSIYIISEQEHHADFSGAKATGMSTVSNAPVYYYHMLVNKVNSKGKSEWNKVVAKKQAVLGNEGGAAIMYSGNKIYFIFNDDIANSKINDPKKAEEMKKPEKSVIVSVAIDSKGEIKKEELYNYKTDDSQIVFMSKASRQIMNTMILYSEAGSKYRLGAVEVK